MSVAIDPNTWYQLTESRVGFTSSLQWDGAGIFMAAQKTGYSGQFWQFQPVGNGNYQIRNLLAANYLQLTTCYQSSEVDASKTRPCMKDARGDASQQWMVQNWGEGDQTFKLVNAGNGTGYNLDCHPGNPLFMNENTAANPVQPAQHWEMTMLSQINNVLYSTTYVSGELTKEVILMRCSSIPHPLQPQTTELQRILPLRILPLRIPLLRMRLLRIRRPRIL
jgi:hypothetical protein